MSVKYCVHYWHCVNNKQINVLMQRDYQNNKTRKIALKIQTIALIIYVILTHKTNFPKKVTMSKIYTDIMSNIHMILNML